MVSYNITHAGGRVLPKREFDIPGFGQIRLGTGTSDASFICNSADKTKLQREHPWLTITHG